MGCIICNLKLNIMALKDLVVKGQKQLSVEDFKDIPVGSVLPAVISTFRYDNKGYCRATMNIGSEGTVQGIIGTNVSFPFEQAMRTKGQSVMVTYQGVYTSTSNGKAYPNFGVDF